MFPLPPLPGMLSIVLPIYNERDNLMPLYEQLKVVLEGLGRPYEILCVNDGSRDGSEGLLTELAGRDPSVKVIHFRTNHGQTAALMAGFDHSRGEVVIPLDADLQNDPADIPALLAKLEEGYDLVSGWRQQRQDGALLRKLPSQMANRLISRMSGIHLHDYGCTLKAYRRQVVENLNLYGEMHRFTPIYASWQGARITELPVRHHPRRQGSSKYGLERVGKVVLDLMVVLFLKQYRTRPIYIFGGISLLAFFMALVSGLVALYLRIFEAISLIQTPLPLLSAFCFLSGLICLLMGLLAEMLVRIYFETQNKPIYYIRETLNLERTP